MYKLRHLQEEVKRAARNFKVVLITGARQVGKSTLLKNLFPDAPIVTFDLHSDSHGAHSDPDFLLRNYTKPLILDEVQYLPTILSAVKREVDKHDQMGQYLLTGSHSLSMLKSVSESLAGRVGIIDLSPMSILELSETFTFNDHGVSPPSWVDIAVTAPETLLSRFAGTADIYPPLTAIWRGGHPALLAKEDHPETIYRYFESYVRTYIERDVSFTQDVGNLREFGKFLRIVAGLSGQVINYATYGCDLSVPRAMVQKWLTVLERTYQWHELPAYTGNTIKRITKKGKGYLTDTGIACHLQLIRNPEQLLGHPLQGAFFETYCVNQIRVLSSVCSLHPALHHWRSKNGAEVDVVLSTGNSLTPIEIKSSMHPNKFDARGIKAFQETYPDKAGPLGIILYPGTSAYPVTDRVIAWPYNGLIKP